MRIDIQKLKDGEVHIIVFDGAKELQRAVDCTEALAGMKPEALSRLIESVRWHVKNPLMRGADGNLEQDLAALEESK